MRGDDKTSHAVRKTQQLHEEMMRKGEENRTEKSEQANRHTANTEKYTLKHKY